MLRRLSGLAPRARGALATVLLVAAAALLMTTAHEHYPVQHWLVWRYAGYWLATTVMVIGCLGVGQWLSERCFRLRLPLHEGSLVSFALGLYVFGVGVLLSGLLRSYGDVHFFAYAGAFLVAALPGARSLLRRWRRVLRRPHAPLSPSHWLLIGFGLFALALIYFAILTPENVQFDSRWKHMSLAEDWVAWGGARRCDEGWLFCARPQFSSYLYVWAFESPASHLFDKMVLSAHLEFAIFALTTWLGIPAFVRRLAPRSDPRLTWIARFLFPGVFVYDSSLSGGADHIGALFALAAALLLLRVWRALELRRVAMLSVMVAACILVKETTALMVLPFVVLTVALRAVLMLAGARRERSLGRRPANAVYAPLLAIGLGLLLTSPLWLKNLAWFGDPIYPALHDWFSPKPWVAGAAYKAEWGFREGQMWAPPRSLAGLLATIKALFTFSLEPNDWRRFHGDVPVFGFLFTLLLPSLLLLRKTSRVWAVALWVHIALFFWYSVHHQDRYLQGIVPMMVGVTAAILVLLWRQHGAIVRGAAVLLVGLQVAWGLDAPFLQTHAMAKSPYKKVLDLLEGGYRHKYESRFAVQMKFQRIADELPGDARLLLHETNINLGTGVTTVLDNPEWQYGIDYGRSGSLRGVHQLLTSLGVTHLYSDKGDTRGADSLAGELLFNEYLRRHTDDLQTLGRGYLASVSSTVPAESDDTVLLLSCGHDYRAGMYRLRQLTTPPYGPAAKRSELPNPVRPLATDEPLAGPIAEAHYVVHESRCFARATAQLRKSHARLTQRGKARAFSKYEYWSRGRLSEPHSRRRAPRKGRDSSRSR